MFIIRRMMSLSNSEFEMVSMDVIKVKVTDFSPYHALKAYRGSRGISPTGVWW